MQTFFCLFLLGSVNCVWHFPDDLSYEEFKDRPLKYLPEDMIPKEIRAIRRPKIVHGLNGEYPGCFLSLVVLDFDDFFDFAQGFVYALLERAPPVPDDCHICFHIAKSFASI